MVVSVGLASRLDGIPGSSVADSPFLTCIGTLIWLISHHDMREAWSTAPRQYSVAVFKQFERLFLTFSRWYATMQRSITAAEVVEPPPAMGTIILLNPEIQTDRYQGPMLPYLQAFEADATKSLGPERHMSYWLHPTTLPPAILFGAEDRTVQFDTRAQQPPSILRQPSIGQPGAAGPFGSAQASVPLPLFPQLPAPAPAPAPSQSRAQVAAAARASHLPRQNALRAPIRYKDPRSASSPGKILSNLFNLTPRTRPSVRITDPDGTVREKGICFYFSADSGSPESGCTGKIYDNKKNRVVDCKRLHVDMSDPSFANLDKSAFEPLHAWLQHSAVKNVFESTDALKTKME